MKKITFLVAALCATMMVSAADYVKVVTEPTDWAGTYIIVYEDETTAYVYNGLDQNVAAGGGYTSATIASGKITATDAVEVKVAAMTGGYSIQVGSGDNADKYVSGKTTDANGIVYGDVAIANTLALESDGVKVTSPSKVVLRFNKTATEMRFRYYKSTSYTGQAPIQFYKKESTTAIENVELSNVYANNGTIYGAENGRIYTILGMDVTEQNGSLNGIYVVKANGKTQKIAVK